MTKSRDAATPPPSLPRALVGKKTISFPVLRGNVLGVTVLRGYAPLDVLSALSKPDVYDQNANPLGTQRDLEPKHARDAYAYVVKDDIAFWPELILCSRVKKVATFKPSDEHDACGMLTFDVELATSADSIALSRVDGNHRLHFADGHNPQFPAVSKTVSFCVAVGLRRDEEIMLFRDINKNQRRMNTSHLDNIDVRLTAESQLKRDNPTLFVAEELASDSKSPFANRVYLGGAKAPGVFLPLRTLKTGIEYMLSQSRKLHDLRDVDVKYRVIRNYFAAVKQWQPEAWKDSENYLLLRGAGFWAICFIGADVIDRVLSSGRYKVADMLAVLKSGPEWDWSSRGDFRGYSGRGGANEIKQRVISSFKDASGISIRDLSRKIMAE